MDKWIGLGVFLWLLGFFGRLFGFVSSREQFINLPKWVSIFFFTANIPISSLVFQTLGFSMIIYSLTISKLIPNGIIAAVAGILIPTFFTRFIVDILRK